MTAIEVELGRRLRLARKAWKLSQADVAKALDLPRSAVSEMEAGRRGVSGLELHRLAYLYGRDMADFLDEDFEPTDAIAALFSRHAKVRLSPCALEPLRRCAALGRETANLERRLGRGRRRTGLPAYPQAPPGSQWEAVEQGSAVADDERSRLNLENRPLPDMARLLESQGVRTTLVDMPDNISGLVFMDSRTGFIVAANRSHPVLRRRFSFAHEYAHLLFDRKMEGRVSITDERGTLREVRANAFAASFLMPADAVRAFVADLAKGHRSRRRIDIYDENAPLRVSTRSKAKSQRLQLHDVVLLAHHFVASCPAVLYRLVSLRLITDEERKVLADQHAAGVSRRFRLLFGLAEPDQASEPEHSRARFLHLALEAFRQEEITRRKLMELVQLAGVDESCNLSGILDDFAPSTTSAVAPALTSPPQSPSAPSSAGRSTGQPRAPSGG